MRSSLSFALAAMLIAPAAQPVLADPVPSPYAAWKWARAIVPNAASPSAEQCVVLDVSLFAGAAPGLRDVRLLQDGRELAYATDISLDDRNGKGTDGDRALYEVALVLPAHPSIWAGVAGGGSLRPDHPPGWFFGQGLLPAHVPVERIRLDTSPVGTEFFTLRAAEASRLSDAETLEATLTREHPAALFTIGANLQQVADIQVGVHGDAATISSFVLEMRRREICYQPLSGSPVTLLFGNVKALPVHYDFGRYFQPKATPLLSSMGPVHANPAFREAPAPRARLSSQARLILELLACSLALVLTLRRFVRTRPLAHD